MTDDNALRSIIEPWLAAERLELDDLEMLGAGRTRTLRVIIDGDDRLDLDRISGVSEGLSRLLDSESDLDGPYQLEVSSPGLERKLRRPEHYVKSIGREVKVKLRRDDRTRTVDGVIESVDGTGFVLSTEGARDHITFEDVVTAKTVFRWEKSPKPGKKENAK